jgi:hypothetical protein
MGLYSSMIAARPATPASFWAAKVCMGAAFPLPLELSEDVALAALSEADDKTELAESDAEETALLADSEAEESPDSIEDETELAALAAESVAEETPLLAELAAEPAASVAEPAAAAAEPYFESESETANVNRSTHGERADNSTAVRDYCGDTFGSRSSSGASSTSDRATSI